MWIIRNRKSANLVEIIVSLRQKNICDAGRFFSCILLSELIQYFYHPCSSDGIFFRGVSPIFQNIAGDFVGQKNVWKQL